MQTEAVQDQAILLLKWELWADYTENVILQYDAMMFPEEIHHIFSKADIRGHITYQDEHEMYLFNSDVYIRDIEQMMHKHGTPLNHEFDEVKRLAAILSVFAARLRAWELFHPPRRGLTETLRDDRIPWKARRILHKNPQLQERDRRAKGGLRSLSTGRLFSDDVDLIILSTLASYGHRNQMSPEWLRPFILT